MKAINFNLKSKKNEEKRMVQRRVHEFIGDKSTCVACGKKKWDRIHLVTS